MRRKGKLKMDKDLKIIYSIWILGVLITMFLPLVSSSPALTDNLLSYWKLDDDLATTNVIDSLDVNDGTASQNTNLFSVAGKIDKAFNYTMSNELVNITGFTSTSQNYTFTFWANRRNIDFIFDYHVVTGNRIAITLGRWATDGQLTFYTDDETPESFGADAYLNTNQWYFLAITLDATGGTGEGFVNGSSVGELPYTGQDIGGQVHIGCCRTPTYNEFDGEIDEFGIWERVLTDAEILELYNSGSGLTYPFAAADTCTCAGLNEDWEIDMSDYCNITDSCDLGTGTLSFTGAGTTKCDAVIKTTNLGDPGASGLLSILDNCTIYVS